MAKPNFEKRISSMKQPAAPRIKNKDGSYSTHRMFSYETSDAAGNPEYKAAATVVQTAPATLRKRAQLTEMSMDDAVKWAEANKEFKTFKTAEEAQAWASGGYKKSARPRKLSKGPKG